MQIYAAYISLIQVQETLDVALDIVGIILGLLAIAVLLMIGLILLILYRRVSNVLSTFDKFGEDIRRVGYGLRYFNAFGGAGATMAGFMSGIFDSLKPRSRRGKRKDDEERGYDGEGE